MSRESVYDLTKPQAIKLIKSWGYTDHFDTGESGDHGYGSRLYFKAPDAKHNDFGFPVTKHGTVSKLGRRWVVSDFNR